MYILVCSVIYDCVCVMFVHVCMCKVFIIFLQPNIIAADDIL